MELNKEPLLFSCLSSQAIIKCPFCGLFSASFFCLFVWGFFGIFVLLLVISLFEMTLKHNTEVLSSASESKKVAMCLLCTR